MGRKAATTARMIKAGKLLADGKAKTTGEALEAVGYSPATARNPRGNNLPPERLLAEAAKAHGGEDALIDLREPALKALRDLIVDPDTSPTVRAPAALGVLKLTGDAGDVEGDLKAGLRDVAALKRKALRVGVLLAKRYGVEAALDLIDLAHQHGNTV